MRQALFMLLAATVTALASASVPAPAATERAESAPSALTLALQNPQNPQNTPPQSGTTAAPAHVHAHAATLQTVALTAPLATPASAAKDEPASLWQAVGTVAVTLTLIGVIAVRRHQAGKS